MLDTVDPTLERASVQAIGIEGRGVCRVDYSVRRGIGVQRDSPVLTVVLTRAEYRCLCQARPNIDVGAGLLGSLLIQTH